MSACYNYVQSHHEFGVLHGNIRATMERLLDGHTFQLDADAVHEEVNLYLNVRKI